MTPEQIQELEPAFADYLLQFFPCCAYPQTFDLLEVYCRGLLSDLPRKSAEPIALAAGTAVRTLQEFLKDHVWHYRLARDTLIEHVASTLPQVGADDLGTVGLIDETSTVKKGTKTPGVQRQWCGERGKKENCIVTVHLACRCGDLGGDVEVQRTKDGYTLQGYGCPLSAVTAKHPQVCALARALVEEITGEPVTECCERNGRPRCRFRIPAAKAATAP